MDIFCNWFICSFYFPQKPKKLKLGQYIFEGGGLGGMGDFRKKILQTDFDGKNSCKEISGEKYL